MDKYAGVSCIDLCLLKKSGVSALLLDADNTLTRWNCPSASAEAKAFVQSAKRQGFSLIIVSNAGAARLSPLSAELAIPFMPRCMKPLPFRLRRACADLGLSPKRCALIGDQLLTDMTGAWLSGIRPVLVEPIDTESEYAGTKINRRIERVLKAVLRI